MWSSKALNEKWRRVLMIFQTLTQRMYAYTDERNLYQVDIVEKLFLTD
jgi:hypothetical protein